MRRKFETLTEMFAEQSSRMPGKVLFRYKRDGAYQDITWGQVQERVRKLAKALLTFGVQPGDHVAILSASRMEWALADFAILSIGAASVPLYDTLTPRQSAYILQDAGCKVAFASDEVQLGKIIATFDDNPTEKVIVFDPIPDALKKDFVLSIEAAEQLGAEQGQEKALEERLAAVKSDDLASIIYTSGTTGPPKGVMLTHSNFVKNCHYTLDCLPISENDVSLSFLPLSHSFERTAGYYGMMYAGVTICYAQSIDTVADNLKEIHPTVATSVPRLYEKIYARVRAGVEEGGPVKKTIFGWAIGVGKRYNAARESRKGVPFLLDMQHKLAHRLVYRKIHEATGGRLRYFASGGAPLSQEIGEFFHALGIMILEGYGLTETTPIISVNRPDAYKFGTVGLPIEGVEVKIAADGEVLVRGHCVMRGYWNKPDATKEAIDKDGWFHTGDVGLITEEGYLKITDRKKELIVMSNGKNVAPAPLENDLKTGRYISMAMVIGDKRKFMSAIICPDFEALEPWAKEHGVTYANHAELVSNPQVYAMMEAHVKECLRDYARYEQVRRFILLDRDFLQPEDELTPTMKLKRRVIMEHFGDRVEQLYKEAEAAGAN
jgi:long-chain acyl-CoA synthetase